MKLMEFFGKPVDMYKEMSKERNGDHIGDDLFWYIIDHDKLHKDYFFPIAKKLKSLKECGREMVLELYMPMVNKGCKEFYSEKKLDGRLGKVFPAQLRESICERLHDHYFDDIRNGRYKLG